jgi:uncharacterized protein YqeY
MSLQEQLDHDLKEAMLARDETRKRTLRLVKAAIAYALVEKRTAGELTPTLSDAEVLQVITKQARQRRDSIAEFSKAGRLDLVAEEQAELAILEPYLPRQLDAAEVRAIVQQAIADTGASGPKDMGRVMSAAMARVQGLADGASREPICPRTAGLSRRSAGDTCHDFQRSPPVPRRRDQASALCALLAPAADPWRDLRGRHDSGIGDPVARHGAVHAAGWRCQPLRHSLAPTDRISERGSDRRGTRPGRAPGG